jgi:nucleotide-binding universal stress UspA family protein
MSTAATPLRTPLQPPRPPAAPRLERGAATAAARLGPAPVLVVTDGRDGALPAVRAAAVLGARLDAAIQAVAVLEPFPDYALEYPRGEVPAPLSPSALEALELTRAAATHEAMRRQVVQATRGVPGGEWPAQVTLGRPSTTIATMAEERRAALVVIAGGPSRAADRSGGTETALDLARAGSTSVLAVGPEADGTLRRAVVAMDFSPAALRAAGLACRLLAPGGTLSLVHVKPSHELGQAEWEAWDAARDRRVGELFQRLVVTLRGTAQPSRRPFAAPDATRPPVVFPLAAPGGGRRDVTIGTATLVGDPAEELIDYAARVGADLVAVGTHGGGFVERLFVGSVAGELVRRAGVELLECSVLVSPEPTAEERTRAEREMTLGPAAGMLGTVETLDPAEWRLALEGFWRRNDGRRVAVEIDDPGFGAQAVSRGFALLGAAYDPHDGRVDLMLGDPGDRRRHLTRSVGAVRSVAVLAGADGREIALRVEHGKGQTLVTFL